MQIIVKKDELRQKIDKAITDYEVEYRKLLDLYKKKVQDYLEYLEKETKSDSIVQVKQPPFPPSYVRDSLANIHAALAIHQEETVEMDDMEYTNIINGIHSLRTNITSNTAVLNSTQY